LNRLKRENSQAIPKNAPVRTTCQADRPSGCAPAEVAIRASEKVAPQMIPAPTISKYGNSRCSDKVASSGRRLENIDYRDESIPLIRLFGKPLLVVMRAVF